MAYRALIIYSSVTGNTEKIALAFKETLESYNFHVDCYKTGCHDFEKEPAYFEDYDLVCIGSPIMAGTPHQSLMKLLGLYGNEKVFFNRRTDEPNATPLEFFLKGAPRFKTKGVVFCTYCGYFGGPDEATATLELEKLYLDTKGVTVVGMFSTAGREVFHNAVNMVGAILNVGVNMASEMLQRYKDDPQDPAFDKLTEVQRDAMSRCAADKQHWPFETMVETETLGDIPGSVFWHYNSMERPHERDLVKAKTFMADLTEDYFLTATGKPRPSGSVYKVIS